MLRSGPYVPIDAVGVPFDYDFVEAQKMVHMREALACGQSEQDRLRSNHAGEENAKRVNDPLRLPQMIEQTFECPRVPVFELVEPIVKTPKGFVVAG